MVYRFFKSWQVSDWLAKWLNEAEQIMLQELLQGEIERRFDSRATAKPNKNYDVMHNHLIEVKNIYIYIPYREVKFNKHVHQGVNG